MDRLYKITMEFSIDEVLETINCAARAVPGMESIVIDDFLLILNQSINQPAGFPNLEIPYCNTWLHRDPTTEENRKLLLFPPKVVRVVRDRL